MRRIFFASCIFVLIIAGALYLGSRDKWYSLGSISTATPLPSLPLADSNDLGVEPPTSTTQNHISKEQRGRVCFSTNCIVVELAINETERSTGLMFRTSLDLNEGMLFIFPSEGEHSFWMKNTLIPLDMIWLNGQRAIVYISKNNQPCAPTAYCPSIIAGKSSLYTLEVIAGTADRLNLAEGDMMEFEVVPASPAIVPKDEGVASPAVSAQSGKGI